MPVNVNQQTVVFLVCIVTGIISGMLFDLLSITAKKLHFGKSAFFIQDIFLWCTILGFFFGSIYIINGVVLRWYIFLGAIFGVLFYIITLRIFTIKTISSILGLIENIFRKIIKILSLPLAKIARLFLPLKKYVQNILKKKDKFVQKNIAKFRRIKILLKKI